MDSFKVSSKKHYLIYMEIALLKIKYVCVCYCTQIYLLYFGILMVKLNYPCTKQNSGLWISLQSARHRPRGWIQTFVCSCLFHRPPSFCWAGQLSLEPGQIHLQSHSSRKLSLWDQLVLALGELEKLRSVKHSFVWNEEDENQKKWLWCLVFSSPSHDSAQSQFSIVMFPPAPRGNMSMISKGIHKGKVQKKTRKKN